MAIESDILCRFLHDYLAVEFIRFTWVDYSGSVMVRVLTKSFVLSLDQKGQKLSISGPILTACLSDGSVLTEELKSGTDQLWPDWSSINVHSYHPNTASVMCFVEEAEQEEGKAFRRCPRTRLRDITTAAKTKHNIDLLVGMEIEFFIIEDVNGVIQPVQTVHNVYSAASLRNKYVLILEEIVQAFQKAGIQVRQFHSEGEIGCYEISTEPLSPLHSADALYFCHETIRAICAQHGLRATIFPKPFEKHSIVGSHYHLSISEMENEESFLAGMLASWRALAAFYQPNYDSNARVRPGERITWGQQNKTASIRKIRPGYWELRGPDATANHYLTLMAIITAGLTAIESGKELKMKGASRIMAAAQLDDKEATEMGVVDLQPRSLKEAIDSLSADEVLKKAIGPEVIEKYIMVKTTEEAKIGKMVPSERRIVAMAIF
ncbi:uncharacterized protein RAG0_07041 [Rhynchosporium agropyri]|uniref:GS catalytic domain-containing protein n=1 Tax=Rhynchosporium agropyri TaxID=914238 RepID=A0A1E1KJM7_9HELO|nr:uncharacterized protein RAG0_07041 [Rhynchosporium agropyri]